MAQLREQVLGDQQRAAITIGTSRETGRYLGAVQHIPDFASAERRVHGDHHHPGKGYPVLQDLKFGKILRPHRDSRAWLEAVEQHPGAAARIAEKLGIGPPAPRGRDLGSFDEGGPLRAEVHRTPEQVTNVLVDQSGSRGSAGVGGSE